MDANKERTVPQPGRLTPGYVEVILMVLIIVGVAIYGYDRFFAQKIRVVDLGAYLREQKALLAAGDITTEEFKSGLDRVDQLVSVEADLNKNQVFILKEVVLKNGDEVKIR